MDRHSQVTMHSEHPNTGTLSRSEPTHRDDFPPSGHNRFDAFFFNRKFTDLLRLMRFPYLLIAWTLELVLAMDGQLPIS